VKTQLLQGADASKWSKTDICKQFRIPNSTLLMIIIKTNTYVEKEQISGKMQVLCRGRNDDIGAALTKTVVNLSVK
jgi:hypothetical protein